MHPIRRLRLQTGLTQIELANRGATSQPTIAAYEAGLKSPTLDTLNKLARALDLEATIAFATPLTREDLRSLAYHEAIARKLRADRRDLIANAKRHLAILREQHPNASLLLETWRIWLDLDLGDLISCILDPSVWARDMRQVTPFAGALTARERLDVIKKFRKAYGS